jgi:tetratricopeptide (TPR) repeat protein
LLKWLQFKDQNKLKGFLTKKNSPITDDDLEEKSFQVDNNTIEGDFYRQYMISILLCMCYCYMELRNYTEAIKCLNECLLFSEKMPEIYLRRGQALIYNKSNKEDQWLMALADLQKARVLLLTESDVDERDKELEELISLEIDNVQELFDKQAEEVKSKITGKKVIFLSIFSLLNILLLLLIL